MTDYKELHSYELKIHSMALSNIITDYLEKNRLTLEFLDEACKSVEHTFRRNARMVTLEEKEWLEQMPKKAATKATA